MSANAGAGTTGLGPVHLQWLKWEHHSLQVGRQQHNLEWDAAFIQKLDKSLLVSSDKRQMIKFIYSFIRLRQHKQFHN